MSDEVLSFIDFGAGRGNSFGFAASCAPGAGLAIDKSDAAVAACKEKGIAAEQADVLDFDRRNVCTAAFAVDLFQEFRGRDEFREALVRITRAARDFVVIQHSYFDLDAELGAKGQCVPDNFGKKIGCKPTTADYVDFVSTHYKALALSGVAIFASGEAQSEPFGLEGMTPDEASDGVVPKRLRVVLGRKTVARFRPALKKVQTGRQLFMWESPSVV